MRKRILAVGLAMVLVMGSAYAANITIPDESSSGTGWYGPQEDQEVEVGNLTGQCWDLEAFYLTGTTMTMVGGYNFVEGAQGCLGSRPGDIFIDINGNAQYGAGAHAPQNYYPNQTVNDTFGYDFVVDMDFINMTYQVYDIRNAGSSLAILQTVSGSSNDESNPWRYVSGGTQVGNAGQIGYSGGLSNSAAQQQGYNVTGGTHYAASIDLGWLIPFLTNGSFTSHYTMECGNDNLMGHGQMPVAEPSTLILGCMGIAGLIMRKRVRV